MSESIWYALLAMIFWGAAPLFGKLGLMTLEPVVALAIRSLIVTAILIGVIFYTGKWQLIAQIQSREAVFIGLEGLCAALLGQLAYYYALKLDDIGRVSPMVAAFPLVALVLGVLILNEKLTLIKASGAFLIVLGICLINYR